MTRLRAIVFAVTLASLLTACRRQADDRPPHDVEATAAALISDQANGGGKQGFAWIPPMVTAAPAFTTLDQTGGTSALTIKIDRLFSDNTTATKTSFTGTGLTMVTGTSSTAFPGVTGPFYGANWTPGATVASGETYRVSVQALSSPTRVLGIADVQVVANSTAAGMVDRTKFTPLVVNSTLRIVFRLEAKDVDGDTINDWKDNCVFTKNTTQLDSNGDGRGNACQCLSVPNGTPCSTGCKTGETCQSGACSGGSNKTGSCSTGNPCKQSETCTNGVCGGGSSKTSSCSTGNPCKQSETCTNGVCGGGSSKTGSCSTGNPCKQSETCTNGVCGGGSNKTGSCSTGNPCKQSETCTNGVCGGGSNRSNGTACGDGNLCTQTDTCQTGVCTGGGAITCVADACHSTGVCDPTLGVCPARKADGTACNDNMCLSGKTCQAGACSGGTAVTCPGADQCHTVAACVPTTGCPAPVTKTNGSTCSDGNACTTGETCQAGACSGGTTIICPGVDQCHTVAACSATSGCTAPVTKANGTACSDGNACTQTDTCQGGLCVGANPVQCVADQCHSAGTCAPGTGICSNPPLPGTCAPNAYDYDRAGRLIRDRGANLGYDAFDQLRTVTPVSGSTAGGPTVAEVHTYGYDGLRTSTTTGTGPGADVQLWFTQDYAQHNGRREHYVRIGDRIVAKITTQPPLAGSDGGVGVVRAVAPRDLRERLIAALALALGLTALLGALRRPGWILAIGPRLLARR